MKSARVEFKKSHGHWPNRKQLVGFRVASRYWSGEISEKELFELLRQVC